MFGRRKQFVIELDGAIYRCSGSTIEQIADIDDIDGDIRFISDCQGAISRTQTTEAPCKYAEVMIRKQLQEAGEFDEPISVITHWKKKKAANATDIFFSALPARLYYQYLDRTKTREDCTIFLPLYAVILSALRNQRDSAPVAVAFQHDRFADLVIGTRKRIYYANRCVAYDATREQMASLWQTVASDIEESEKENHITIGKLLIITWLDSQVDPELPPGLTEKMVSMEEESVFFDGRERQISFLKACEEAPVSFSISGSPEKMALYSRKFLPFLNGVALLLCLLFFAGQMWSTRNVTGLRKAMEDNQKQIMQMRNLQLPALVPYEEQLDFVKALAEYQELPSFKRLLNDIAMGIPKKTFIDVLKADYQKGALGVEVLARMELPFDKAHRGYQEFAKMITKMGYSTEKSDFQTTIHESHFVSTFKKKAR